MYRKFVEVGEFVSMKNESLKEWNCGKFTIDGCQLEIALGVFRLRLDNS